MIAALLAIACGTGIVLVAVIAAVRADHWSVWTYVLTGLRVAWGAWMIFLPISNRQADGALRLDLVMHRFLSEPVRPLLRGTTLGGIGHTIYVDPKTGNDARHCGASTNPATPVRTLTRGQQCADWFALGQLPRLVVTRSGRQFEPEGTE